MLSVNTYAARNGKLEKVTYRTGDVRTYTYNWRGQTLAIGNGENALYRYVYDLNGTLTQFIDNLAQRKTLYVQDSLGRPVRQTLQTLSGTHIGAVEYGYDQRNNVDRLAVDFGGHTHTARYLYTTIEGITNGARFAAENLPTQYRYASSRYANYEYTSLNMLKARTFTTETPLTNTYEYYPSLREQSGDIVYFTSLLKNETINGIIYQYSYDLSGNITSVKKGASEDALVNYRSYTYDDLSQLTSETYYDDTGAETKTITYTYDGYGNILSRTVNDETVNYTYGTDADAGWSKLLTSYDSKSINYDEIGNPEYYMGADLTWTNGRQLKKYQTDDTTVTYTYDDAGMRTSKTVNGVESTYLYLDGKLHGEVRDGHHIHYSYDSYGNLSVIKYYKNDTDYNVFYVMTNVFGDVVSLHNANGTQVASYEYDSWGNVISMTDTTGIGIATINPIRYRGYCYDSETGLYYLSSRYYDPQVGRFINADSQLNQQEGTTGYNVYQYCGNNPVNRTDATGKAWYHWAIGAAIVVACAAATVVTCGGFAAAAGAVAAVGSGVAAATTASTIAAGAFIGSATVYGLAVASAASTSSTVEEFNEQGNWGTVGATILGGIGGGCDGYTLSSTQTPKPSGGSNPPSSLHTSGLGSPKNNINPGGSYTKFDSGGGLYSYTQFDDLGRQTMRIDFQGRPHAGTLPHIHLYTYPQQGGRAEYVFDLSWHLID